MVVGVVGQPKAYFQLLESQVPQAQVTFTCFSFSSIVSLESLRIDPKTTQDTSKHTKKFG